jgi:UPF0755 protein
LTTERRPKQKRGRLRSRLRLAGRIVLLLGLAAAVGAYAWQREKARPALASGRGPQTVVVAPGATVGEIARLLHEHGLVRHPFVFRAMVLERGVGNQLKAGQYRFTAAHTTAQVLESILRGDIVHRRVTFPEGRSIGEMAQMAALQAEVSATAFRQAARDPALIRDLDPTADDLEGYLFPDTYEVPQSEPVARTLVARMVRRFREVAEPSLPLLKERDLSLRQAVTLASLVELETAQPEERPLVAAVFLNRLKKKMLLQTDPTVIYALRRAGRYDGNIHKVDLTIDSPYNTYRVGGLPPGPIASPGRAAFEAVLHPAQTQDIYFVSRNDGTHQFSATLKEHERAVDRYQRHRSASTGVASGEERRGAHAPARGQ